MTWAEVAAIGVVFGLLACTSTATAQVRTCLEVASNDAAKGLAEFVTSEVNRHASHQIVVEDCQSFLHVEVVVVAAGVGREHFVTVRLDANRPRREEVGEDGLAAALERALGVVLEHDPRAPPSGGVGWDQLALPPRLEQRGRNHLGVELLDVGAIVGGELTTLPGVAVAVRREVARVQVGARISAAACPLSCERELHFSRQLVAQFEVATYSSATKPTATLGAALLGFEYQRFYGRRRYDPGASYGGAAALGPSLGLRGGVEFLRHTNTRFLFFAQVQTPLFIAHDRDHGVIKRWVPSLALGVGAGF